MEPSADRYAEARAQGKENIYKGIDWLVDKVAILGNPKGYAEVASGIVQEKWENSRTKQELDKFVDKGRAAAERLEQGFNRVKDKVQAKGVELGKRGAVLGLSPLAVGEGAMELAFSVLPAVVEDFKKRGYEKEEKKLELKMARVREAKLAAKQKTGEHLARGEKMRPIRTLVEKLKPGA